MGIPYHFLQVTGNILFAAQGGNIVSFNSEGIRLATWKHPSQIPENLTESNQDQESTAPQEGAAPDEPPAKRRRVGGDQEEAKTEESKEENGHSADASTQTSQKRKKGKGSETPRREAEGKPVIQALITAENGSHVVALTGADKTIWVFEHDGAGNLKQLSQRVMPKRPSFVTLTVDDKTILSADKFGDVYSVPLIPTDSEASDLDERNREEALQSRLSVVPAHTVDPQANETTVHTQRNLRALKDQLRHREERQRELERKIAEGNAEPQFEHALLLGHVSMLTSVLAVSSGERPYIITADRDEHIRISRGVPQAHVIEGYCFGHSEFVSKLCVPTSRPDILISGGGDNEILVFDWKAGALLSKVNLLGKVQEVLPDAGKIAVSGLHSWQEVGAGQERIWVAVIVERVPALFLLHLTTARTLEHNQLVSLPGNPLSIAPLGSGPTGRLLVAIDPNGSAGNDGSLNGSVSSIRTLEKKNEAGWQLCELGFTGEEVSAGNEPNVGMDELVKVLYSTESLRKRGEQHSAQEMEMEASSLAGDE